MPVLKVDPSTQDVHCAAPVPAFTLPASHGVQCADSLNCAPVACPKVPAGHDVHDGSVTSHVGDVWSSAARNLPTVHCAQRPSLVGVLSSRYLPKPQHVRAERRA